MTKVENMIKELCPNGITSYRLEEFSTQLSGMSAVSGKWKEEGNCQFIDYMNAYKNIRIDVNDLPFATVKSRIKQTVLQKGDVLFTSASETPDECALAAVIEDDIADGIFLDDHLFGIRVKEEWKVRLHPAYLKYIFRAPCFRKEVNKSVRGVTRFYISKADFMKSSIPVPPMAIQVFIADFLDKLTTLTAELEAELEARKQQYEYYRNKLLTFNEIGEANRQVTWKKISEIGQICMCKRIMKDQTHKQGEIPFYKIGTFGGTADAYISRELFEDYRARFKFPKKGDLLISAAGTIGKTVVFDGKDSYFQDSNIVWVDNDETIVTNRYLYHIYKIINWKTDGGTIRRLYNDNLRNTIIPVPSMEEQSRIVSILDRFEALTTDWQSGLPAEIEARRQQYEYYRNKLLTFEAV